MNIIDNLDSLRTDLLIAKISKIVDIDKYIIECTNDNLVLSNVCYPIIYLDEPKLDDEVLLFNLNPLLNNSFLYIPMKYTSFNGWRYSGNSVELVKGGGVRVKSAKKVNISNDNTSLLKVLLEIIKMYMKTKTIDGKVLDPSSISDANNVIKEITKLLN